MPNVTRRFLLLTTLACGLTLGLNEPLRAQAPAPDASRWVIEPDEARTLLAEGALLLDTRGDSFWQDNSIPGAVRVVWQDYAQTDAAAGGRLLEDDAVLTGKLRALGVSADRPVIVVADSLEGWGEDGRIVWMLRTLGHEHSYLVNGGVAALLDGGDLTATPGGVGDFTVARTDAYDISGEELAARLGSPGLVILDTREPREYEGATPYGETRGGHVPGAQSIYFQELVDENGRILEGEALRARLTALGIEEGSEVVSYCTAGIRSGFVTAVLNDAGITARNYSGSMREWSAGPADAFPLVLD